MITIAGDVRAAVLDWYAGEARDFPWRRTRDPYAVLVSEVMLQQTQAARVVDRFPRFLARFPTTGTLAAASEAAVVAAWSGLGYNRRALALRSAAAIVERDGWPTDVAALERLPGVGPYTARAVASLAFDVPAGVVDTNVRRWLLRRFGGPDNPRQLQELADALAATDRAADVATWTHASMEFGAAVCRGRAPRCSSCPIAEGCPSRHAPVAIRVPSQPPLRGSDRAYRGAIVARLSRTRRHELSASATRRALAADAERLGPALDDEGWERVVAGLERDGLAHRRAGRLRLGAATIRP